MAALVFLALAAGLLGALAAAYGSDSRAKVEDTHTTHDTLRWI